MIFNVLTWSTGFDHSPQLGTYTNLENHPRLIPARTDNVPRIRLDRRTGLPTVQGDANASLTNSKSREKEQASRQALRQEVLGHVETIHGTHPQSL
jgi:hypothetical protein